MEIDLKDSCFWMGGQTHKVPMELHTLNRKRLCARLRNHPDVIPGTLVLLRGGDSFMRHCSDAPIGPFRQESYFQWLFGVREPGCFGALDVDTERTLLFFPPQTDDDVIWDGRMADLTEQRVKYAVHATHNVGEIDAAISLLQPRLILTLKVPYSGRGFPVQEATFPGIEKYTVCNSVLKDEMIECRVIKTDLEVAVLRYANHICSRALMELMRRVHPGMYEFQAESLVTHYCYANGGMRCWGWTNVFPSGRNASRLSYGNACAPNQKRIDDGDICSFDLSTEYHCYGADITCSFPVNGKFTPEQKDIYNAVLRVNRTVLAASKPGVSAVETHRLAGRTLLSELTALGLLRGDLDEMMSHHLFYVFMPTGGAHLVGVDVVDVGGFPKDYPGPRNLKRISTARMLEKNLVITIEPGCYFIDYQLAKAKANPKLSKFLVPEVIDRYYPIGGIRIEDTVVITDDGAELFTHPSVPRTVEEIEAFMQNRTKEAMPISFTPHVATQRLSKPESLTCHKKMNGICLGV